MGKIGKKLLLLAYQTILRILPLGDLAYPVPSM
jgi:hypothetical protein